MKNLLKLLIGSTFAVLLSLSVLAQEIEPAVIFDMGGKFDKSFNEAAYNGAEKFKNESGIAYREFEVQNPSQREQAMRNFARRGQNPIIGIGFAQGEAMTKVATEFPDLNFAIVDMVVEKPNVRSIVFKEHEGSYLVGMIAAMKSETGKVGFVGGMDIPLISKFACGYKQGAKSISADIEVYENMTGTTPAAWNDPVKGGELAKSQFDRGADVVFAAAGATGLGVLQAAADLNKFSIGVDSNQNHLHPGSVLTSMIKRVDFAVEEAMKDAQSGSLEGGIHVLGLAEGGVGYALDDNNKDLISSEMKSRVDAAAEDIKSGKIQVHDYTDGNSCPL